MGYSGVVRKKFKLKTLPKRLEPNALYYIKAPGTDIVEIYVTDLKCKPFKVKSGNSEDLIRDIINTDGFLTIEGDETVIINLSDDFKEFLLTLLKKGDNISELVNDAGYITMADVPIENIKRNGEILLIEDKTVDIEVPTKTSQIENDSGFITDVSGKLDKVIVVTDKKQVYVKDEQGNQIMLDIDELGDHNVLEGIRENGVLLQPDENKIVDLKTKWISFYEDQDTLLIPNFPTGVSVTNYGRGNQASNTSFGLSNFAKDSQTTYSTALGTQAAMNMSRGYSNLAVGFRSLYRAENVTNMTAIGTQAFMNLVNQTDTASGGIAIGASALVNATEGLNIAIGASAGQIVTSGKYNFFLGDNAGFRNGGTLTGNRNIAIGLLAGSSLSGSQSNNVLINNRGGGSDNIIISQGSSNVATNGDNNTILGKPTLPATVSGVVAVSNALGTNALFMNGQGNVGFGTVSPNTSAKVDITATDKGVLLPRLTTEQRNNIQSPASGLIIFNTTNKRFEFFDTSWKKLNTEEDASLLEIASDVLGGIKAESITESNYTTPIKINQDGYLFAPEIRTPQITTLTSNSTLSSEMNRNVISVEGVVNLVLPAGLGDTFQECGFDIISGSLTVSLASGVSVSGQYSLTFYAGEAFYLYKRSADTNVFRIV